MATRGNSHESADEQKRAGTSRGALHGVRVLDLSRVLAGPLCTQMLAMHGADVIKVEALTGDETRLLGPPFEAGGTAAYFAAVNRGKRDIALDLSKPEGREILLQLITNADVLVENFLPGAMERWGLSYETLSRRFPRLIYCQITGFGIDGPLGGLPGYDAVVQAISGLMSVNGSAESGALRVGVPVVDHLTGYTSLIGILLALYARRVTSRGQRVDASLFDAALSLLVPHAANWHASGQTPGLLGSAHPNIAPYDKFAAADGEVFLGILTDAQFRRLCAFIDAAELAEDVRFRTNAARLANRDALRAVLEAALSNRPRHALCEGLMKAGVPAGAVCTVPEALTHPHAQHRGMVVEHEGRFGLGASVKLSETPPRTDLGVSGLSSDANEILEEAGFDATRIEALYAGGIVGRPKAAP